MLPCDLGKWLSLCWFTDQRFTDGPWAQLKHTPLSLQADGTWKAVLLLITLDSINKAGETTISRTRMHFYQFADSRNLSSKLNSAGSGEPCRGRSSSPSRAPQCPEEFLRRPGSSSCLSPHFDVLQIPTGSELRMLKSQDGSGFRSSNSTKSALKLKEQSTFSWMNLGPVSL